MDVVRRRPFGSRGFRRVGSALGLVALVAILATILSPVRAYSGPGPSGGAGTAAHLLDGYHSARPELPVAAWSRTGAWWRGDERPNWIPDPPEDHRGTYGRRKWSTIENDLYKAEIEIAPGIVGRRWPEIGPDEVVIVLRNEGRTSGVGKSGRYVRP